MKLTLLTKAQSCLNCQLVQGCGWHTGQLATCAVQPMSQKCPRPQRHNRKALGTQGWTTFSGENSSKVLGQATYLPQLERFIQAGDDISTAHEPHVDQELVWCGIWEPLEDKGEAGMARGPAPCTVCRCCACLSISRRNLVQNSKTVLEQENAGLPLTHLESGHRGRRVLPAPLLLHWPLHHWHFWFLTFSVWCTV